MRPLTCQKAEQLIVKELDDGLDPSAQTRLNDHLAGCSLCRAFRVECENLFADVKTDYPEDPGDEFWRMYDVSLNAKLREKEMRPRSVWGWNVVGALAAAGVAVLVFALSVGDFRNAPTMDPAVSAAVIEDLNELYGPVGEDYYPSGISNLSAESMAKIAASGSTYDGIVTTWFEVEDESNHLLL